jgi:protein-disulfide isomerase
MGKRRRKKRSAAAPAAAAGDVRRRKVLIGGIGVAVLVLIVVLIAVGLGLGGSRRSVEVMFHGIQGGFTEEGFPYLGSSEADVVLIEFTDFYCSHCRDYNLGAEDRFLEDYVATAKVRYVLHYYSNGSPQSLQATDAAMCAADQGLYFQFQRAFFTSPAATREGFIALARELELDEDEFMACWDAGRHRNALMGHIQAARAMGISSTPSFMINDQLIVGNDPDAVRQAIEDELAAD